MHAPGSASPDLGTFQPSELVKIGFILTFSKHLSVLKDRGLLERPLHVVLLGFHALIPVAVMFQLQGDAGSAAIFFCMFLAMSFGAGVQLRYFIGLFAAIGVAFPFVWRYLLDDYQRDRFTIFLHPESDPTGKGLQQLQGKISIGSGQLWGRGLSRRIRAYKRAASLSNRATISSPWQANSLVLSAAC